MDILERLRDDIIAAPGGGHLARYPGDGWNLKSWSFRVVQDLMLQRSLARSRLTGWRLEAASWLTANAWSHHHDAAYKAVLFKALLRENKNRIVVLPEVGPFGFDLLIARAAGFQRFIAYDKDEPTVESCRQSHGRDAEYLVSSSADFDFARFRSADHLIVFPDWPHDDLAGRLRGFDNVVRYSDRSQPRQRPRVGPADWSGLFQSLDRVYSRRR